MTGWTDSQPGRLRSEPVSEPRQVAVPESARALCALARIDYEDGFAIETGAARNRTPEQWARALLEDAPTTRGRALWRLAATVGVLPRAGGSRRRSVGAWTQRRSTPEVAIVAAGAPVGISAEMIFSLEREALLWTTFVQLRNPLARRLWARIAPVHRGVVPALLKRAQRLE